MSTERRVTIKNRSFDVQATGLKNVPYRLVSGKLVLRGVRMVNSPGIIACLKGADVFGFFNEATGAEMVAA